MSESGFAGGQIGTEYEQLLLAIPHYMEVQKAACRLLTGYITIARRPFFILEIGCGTGLTTKTLLEFLPNARIIAIDKYETMLGQARSALAECPRVTFIESDALKFLSRQKDEIFDAVVTVFCLHNTPSTYRRNCFREMGRVTKRGGIIISADKIAQDNPVDHRTALYEQLDALTVFRQTPHWKLEREWTEHYLEDDRIRLTAWEQVSLLQEAACRNIQCHDRWRMEALYSGVKNM